MKNITLKDGCAVVSVSPKLYPLDVIYSAAYVFLDKAYIVLDGNPKEKVDVIIKPKKKDNSKKLAEEFCNELINYADYSKRAEKTRKAREIILQRALLTNDPSLMNEPIIEPNIDDDEDIKVSWDKKYGGKNED